LNLRFFVAAIIFLSSYFPLSMILLAQNFDYQYIKWDVCNINLNWAQCTVPLKTPVFAIGIFLLCLFSFVITLGTISIASGKIHRKMEIITSKHVPADLMNYVLPYVVSFMSVDYQEIGKFVGFTIFLIWMFWLGYSSGLTILNPMLVAFGWQFYEIEYRFPAGTTSYTCIALSRVPLEPNETHEFTAIQQVFLVR